MNNMVLVELVVPSIEKNYDVFLPCNRKIGNIIELCSKVVSDLSGGYFVATDTICLYNGYSGSRYPFDELVRNTDIRNGSKLILM